MARSRSEFNPEISRLTGAFADPRSERAFRADGWAEWAQQVRITLGFAAILFLGFVFLDYALELTRGQLWLLLTARLTLFVYAIVAIYVSYLRNRCRELDVAALVFAIMLSAAYGVVVAIEPPEVGMPSASIVLIVLGIYLFVPNRLIFTVLSGLTASLAYMYASIVYQNMNTLDIATMALLLLFCNGMGTITAHRMHQARRTGYANLLAEREANQRLQQEAEDRARAEASVRDSEERHRKIFELSPLGMCLVGEDLRYLSVNARLCELLGYSEQELLGLTFPEITHPDDVADSIPYARDSMAGLIQNYQFEKRYIRKNGDVLHVSVTGSAVADDDGNPLYNISMIEDISERKKAEEKLIAAMDEADAANRSKSEFLANMSHELRTPLNAVIGFAEMMKMQTFGPLGSPNYVEYANSIADSGGHLLSLINDILDLSKIESGKHQLEPEPVDVAGIVDYCGRMVRGRADEAGIDLAYKVPAELPRLMADERSLKQILLNLLSNAIKFTSEGGAVTITGRIDADGEFAISVSDTGIGIAARDLGVVLAPFGQVGTSQTRKTSGTGLGLPLVRSLAELHQGTLEIESEVGSGTTVTVKFPASRVLRQDERSVLPAVHRRDAG